MGQAMTHQMIFFKKTLFTHDEVDSEYYDPDSMTEEHDLSQKMANEHGDGMVLLFDENSDPAGSFTVKKGG